MLNRCRNPNSPNYERYGGRGIAVCGRWLTYENFVADMGEPSAEQSLDRINPDGNYEPDNCRWATVREQSLNKRNTRRYRFRGSMLTLKEISEQTGVKPLTIEYRLQRGWPDDLVASAPSSKPLSFRLDREPVQPRAA